MLMEQPLLRRLRAEGTAAQAARLPLSDNRFYRPDHLPLMRDDAVIDWYANACAWKFGWHAGAALERAMLLRISSEETLT
jgi:hypothetical protein